MTEIIISTLIIVMLAGCILGAFIGTQYFVNRSRHRVQAYNFAIEAIDRLRGNYEYSSNPSMAIGSNHDQTEIGAPNILRGEIEALQGTLTYDVEEVQPGGYKQITVKVNWDEPAF